MSHSAGAVRFESDGAIMYFEYNGTCDFCISRLFKTWGWVWRNWRKHKNLDCKCGKDEPVTIFVTYGDGFFWPGRACRKCRAITENGEPFGMADLDLIIDGAPDWSPFK